MTRKRKRKLFARRGVMLIAQLGTAILMVLIFVLVASGGADDEQPDAPPVATSGINHTAPPTDAAVSPTPTTQPTPSPTPTPVPTPVPTPAPTTILISACGDCTLGGVYKSNTAAKFKKYATDDGMDYFMKNVKSIFESDDLTIANLETVLISSGTPRSGREYIMHGVPEYTDILTQGSIEVVTVANNHSKDFSSAGLRKMKQTLDGAGIAYCGYDSYAIEQVKGAKVGFIGYTVWDNKYDKMISDIKAMKKEADIVIVSIHGGDEKAYTPTKDHLKYCRGAADAGADLVLGHHTHVVNGIERYNGTYIVYSLANFCFGGNINPDDKDTFIFQQSFIVNADKSISPGDINVIPCSISSVSDTNNFQPTPLTGEDAERVLNKIAKYSEGYAEPFTND